MFEAKEINLKNKRIGKGIRFAFLAMTAMLRRSLRRLMCISISSGTFGFAVISSSTPPGPVGCWAYGLYAGD